MNRLLCLSLVLAALAPMRVAAGIPDWLAAAANIPTPADCGRANVVVLLDQTQLAVDGDGTVTETHRIAERLLTSNGSAHATATALYIDKSDKVISLGAWLVRSGKAVKTVRNKDWLDIAMEGEKALFDEYRARIADLSDSAITDDVFGYETQVRQQPLFASFQHAFSDSDPAVSESLEVTLPAGAVLDAKAQNEAGLVHTTSPDGRVATWEMRGRPFRPDEPWASGHPATAPMVYGTYTIPVRSKGRQAAVFHSWKDLASWQQQLAEPQCDAAPELAANARELTASCTDTLAKVRALCRYVQGISYIAINKNLGLGFGYRPRKASEVFAKGFGDCKDKVNVLRALLREAGIKSYLLAVQSDRDVPILEAWPALSQFDHAIIGIAADASVQLSTVLDDTPVGRLMIFDPTDPNTDVGDLPMDLQGRPAALIAANSDRLILLPRVSGGKETLIERTAKLNLSENGTVAGEYLITAYGQAGAMARGWLRHASPSDIQRSAVEIISKSLGGLKVTDIQSAEVAEDGTCRRGAKFSAERYAQQMPGNIALVRLDVLNRGSIPTFSEPKRVTPVVVPPIEQRDEIVLTLPPGWTIEERPEDFALETEFGRCTCTYQIAADRLTLKRTLSLRDLVVPQAKYPAFRKFMGAAMASDHSAILLHRS